MASGQLPVDFYHADKVNLRFLGTRALVHNIHESCPVLPKKWKDPNCGTNGQYRQSRFQQRSHQGRRYRPVYQNLEDGFRKHSGLVESKTNRFQFLRTICCGCINSKESNNDRDYCSSCYPTTDSSVAIGEAVNDQTSQSNIFIPPSLSDHNKPK